LLIPHMPAEDDLPFCQHWGTILTILQTNYKTRCPWKMESKVLGRASL
jgi:hypothetical protein